MVTITLELPDQLAERLTHVGHQLPYLLSYALDSAGLDVADVPNVESSPLLEEAISFLAQGPAPSEIVRFKFSHTAQARLEELLDKARAGSLTAVAQNELNTYPQLNHLFILLKAQARSKLDKS